MSYNILPDRKYSYITKYPCTDRAIYRIHIQLRTGLYIGTGSPLNKAFISKYWVYLSAKVQFAK